jgi:uncharacterized protein
MICSFECTFCAACVAEVLGNVCPNCAGGFTPRPVPPATDWKNGNHLGAYPPSAAVRHRPVDAAEHARLRERVAGVPAELR